MISKSSNQTQSSGWFSNLYNKVVGGVKRVGNWIRGATNKVDNFVQERPYVRDIADEVGQRVFNRRLSPYYDRAIRYSNIGTDFVDNIPMIQSNGRIFDFILNKIGNASNSIGRIVNTVKDGYNNGQQ